jgi:hypothetical protein
MQKVTIDLYIKDGENEIKYLRNFLDFLKTDNRFFKIKDFEIKNKTEDSKL